MGNPPKFFIPKLEIFFQILYTDIERITTKIVNQNKDRFNDRTFNLKNIEYVKKIIIKEVRKCFGK